MDGDPRLLIISRSSEFIESVYTELHRAGLGFSRHNAESFADISFDLIRGADLLICDDEGSEAVKILEWLRQDGIDLPVIVLTPEPTVEQIVRGMKAGAQDHIDRSDLSRLAPAVRQALHERGRSGARGGAETVSEEKNHFLSTISHELRTPMTVFMGMVELTLSTGLSQEQRSYLEIAMNSAEALLRNIEDLIDFAQMEQGDAVFASEPFDLRFCIEEAVARCAPRARQKGLTLSVSLKEGLPETIVGDADRLKRALESLIDNAVKFTERGRVRVTAAADRRQRTLSFRVKDTGIGIPREKESLIFQSFTQLDETNVRRFGGMGLGLALTHRIAAGLGGSLAFSSRVGAGSEFRLLLPWDPAAQRASESAPRRLLAGRG